MPDMPMQVMSRENITPDSLNMLAEPILGLSKVIDGYLLATNFVRTFFFIFLESIRGCLPVQRWLDGAKIIHWVSRVW